MQRRTFTRTIFAFGALATLPRFARKPETIIGHGAYRYRVDQTWCKANPTTHPVKDCHEMAMDRTGRIFMSTNDIRNNVLIYNKDGNVLDAWGTEYPGAHGLTLHDENGTEFLYLTDYERHAVYKLSLKGKLIQEFPAPMEAGIYQRNNEFNPTETAVLPNGDVLIADGYGKDYILVYGPDGKFKRHFGGKGTEPSSLNNAHGVALDTRKKDKPEILVSSRADNTLKRYDLNGQFLGAVPLPGAYICRPVLKGDALYFAVLISKLPWDSQSGFVCVLDKENQLVSVPGGSDPKRLHDTEKLYQTVQVFKHPHDVLVDADENVFVTQWNSNGVYPIRLTRI